MTRLRLLFLLLLLLGPQPAVFQEKEENSEEKEFDKIESQLTIGNCKDAFNLRQKTPLENLCCKPYIDTGMEGVQCAELYRLSTGNELIALHNLANCVYIKKKFTKGDENLNFRRIKADLDKIDDPIERKFKMDLYVQCNTKAKESLKAIRAETEPGQLPLGMRRPFYALVFICVTFYPYSVSCPYFLWQKDICGKYVEQCKRIIKDEQN